MLDTAGFLFKEAIKHVIDSFPSPMFVIDGDLTIIELNQSMYNMIASTDQNKKIAALFPSLAQHDAIFSNALKSGNIDKISQITLPEINSESIWEVMIFPIQQLNPTKAIIQFSNISLLTHIQNLGMQNEKFASLGLLLSGVAHEINNPINFIMTNINPLKNDVTDIISILNKYSEISESNLVDKLKEVNALKDQLQLDYILEEISQMLAAMDDGVKRTAFIIKALRNYSRAENNIIRKVDIHESIESALTLLRYNYKDRITITKEFANLPAIDGISGKIAQIFMNILSNAIQAIEDKGDIRIVTECIDDKVKISIKDNGHGIKEENKPKIFRSFFTTKGLETGTGFGLMITHSIIKESNGTIEYTSKEGEGTEFIITLPISSKSNERLED